MRVASDEAPSTAIERGESNGVRPEKREVATGMAANVPPIGNETAAAASAERRSVAGGRDASNIPATGTRVSQACHCPNLSMPEHVNARTCHCEERRDEAS